MTQVLQKILSNRISALIFLVCCAAGGVVAIAGGYYTVFRLVTMVGNG